MRNSRNFENYLLRRAQHISMGKKVLLILLIIVSAAFVGAYFMNREVGVTDSFEGLLAAPCGGIDGGYFCSAPPTINYEGKICTMNLLIKTLI